MKLTLILSMLISFNLFADWQNDYMDVEDGYGIYSRYIGSCTLHEHYEDTEFNQGFDTYYKTIDLTSAYYPRYEYYSKLNAIETIIFDRTYKIAMYEEYFNPRTLDDWTLDDITISKMIYPGRDEVLYQVSYGVGGGNGGYLTFAFTPYQQDFLKLLSHTFDGDLLECDPSFEK